MPRNKKNKPTDWSDPTSYIAEVRLLVGDAIDRMHKFTRSQAAQVCNSEVFGFQALGHLEKVEQELATIMLRAACPTCAQTGLDGVCVEHERTLKTELRALARRCHGVPVEGTH